MELQTPEKVCIKNSEIHGSGLFATEDISEKTAFPVSFKKLKIKREIKDKYLLDLYLSPEIDYESECFSDGKITRLCDVY